MKPTLTLLAAMMLAPLAGLHAQTMSANSPLAVEPSAGNAASEFKPQPGLAYEYLDSGFKRLQEYGIAPDIGPRDKGHGDWGLRFTGLLTVSKDGDYAFRAEADTGVRVKLDGKLIINGWSPDGARTGKAPVTKAHPAVIVVEYCFDSRKGGKKAALRLFWTPPGGQVAPVPATAYTHMPPLIEVRGDDQSHLNLQLPDGGLKPVVGVQNIQILRVNHNKPELADGDGWTYAHHQDLAVWKGRLYAAWVMLPKDEDAGPQKVIYATSADGFHWSAPADLFPREFTLANRFYFYHATNGRMLAFCAGKYTDSNMGEAGKKVLLVREITADHRLGEVFTLINLLPPGRVLPSALPASFETAMDAGFVAACREAARNNLLLEQQDFGVFLGTNKIDWHDDPVLSLGFWKFGKAFCFYHRQDGAAVGLSKMGWATLSDDKCKTWSRPVQPPSLYAGSGKIWGQRTTDGRYALLYNPNPTRTMRYPLVMVHGDDGRVFRDMRVVHGEVPKLRYGGQWKMFGAQYMRGLAEWADDGTFADRQAMWMIYSTAKEDIWVSRIPLPVKPDETVFPADDFAKATPGAVVPGWNLYSPKWAPVTVVENAGKRSLELRDGDPFDYARAVRVFPESAKVRAELDLAPAQANARLEIELCDPSGLRPVRVVLTETGRVQAADGKNVTELGKYAAGEKLSLVITADAAAGRYSVNVNGGATRELTTAAADAKTLQRLSLRTGVWRGFGEVWAPDGDNPSFSGKWREDGAKWPVDTAADVPLPTPAVFQVQRVKFGRP